MQLPIGYSDFAEIRENHFDFVDKTLLIKELLDNAVEKVTLITRPRRFGKTLNLSMIKCFFKIPAPDKSTQKLFENLKIHQAGAKYMAHQGKYPVVFITFKDMKERTYENSYNEFAKIMSKVYGEHRYLVDAVLYDDEKKVYESILNKTATSSDIVNSLRDLTQYLSRYHQQKVIILIDEYDAPIQTGYLNGYYEEIINLFRHFLGAALKDNADLFRAVLTGILRVSRESLFSGLNNIKAYSVLNQKYSEHFGFTESEVSQLLHQANLREKARDIKEWYNGYQIGETVLYNPWSIVNCIHEQGILKPHWINTSDNALIKKLLLNSSPVFKELFETLLRDRESTIQQLINENFVYADFDNQNDLAAWSLLLMAGYLKVVQSEQSRHGAVCELAIPNLEIRDLYQQIIEQWLIQENSLKWYNQFISNLLEGNVAAFEKDLAKIFEQTVSFHDVAKEPESFYHALIIGLTATLGTDKQYEIRSNRESGDGRYDYCILSRDPEKLSIVFEFKKAPKLDSKKLKALAKSALKQIAKNNYLAEIKQRGGKKVLKIGMAFSGKDFVLAHEQVEC